MEARHILIIAWPQTHNGANPRVLGSRAILGGIDWWLAADSLENIGMFPGQYKGV